MGLDPSDELPLPEAVWDLYRRDEPDPRAIQAAYLRFAARRPEPLSAFRLLRWLVAGFAAGWGVAFAATGDPLFGAGLRRDVPAPVVEARASVRTYAPSPASAPATQSAFPPELPAPEPKPPNGSAHSGGAAPQAVLEEPPTIDPKWQRAAAALRARDYEAAEEALREVETAGAPADRDAASLALAQVLLTRGRVVEARARLERLSMHAGSALVREKATTLLAELSSPGDRSIATPTVPQ